jgi:hypothetical protein
MAEPNGPPRLLGLMPFAPVEKACPERTKLWRAKQTALANIFLKVYNGNAAGALARLYWPFLWDGEKAKPPRFTNDQRKAQANAPREAVERWLLTYGRQLQWRLELAGGWQESTETRILRSDVRDEIATWGENHQRASNWLRKLAEQPDNKTNRDNASKYLDKLHNVDDHALMKQSIGDPLEAWKQYHCVAVETQTWLDHHDANGGVNLAAREVAKLVAIFFDGARSANLELEDAKTAKRLRVRSARSNDGKEPENQYSRTVADALVVFGLPRESWRRATEAVSKDYPHH